jgi:hypothetical protein
MDKELSKDAENASSANLTAVEWLVKKLNLEGYDYTVEQAKEMEKDKHERFNKFLNDEKELVISDLKTIERIQWYYNTYFNETYGGNK